MAGFVELAINGDEAMRHAFENMSRRQVHGARKRMVAAGGKVVVGHARKEAPFNSDREDGEHLRDTLITKERDYSKKGKSLSVIGPASYRAPHKHLVEFGSTATKRPAVKDDPLAFRWARLGERMVKIRHTGKMPASHFLAEATKKSAKQVDNVMTDTFRDSLMRAWRKEVRNINKIAGKHKAPKFSKKELKAIGSLG